VDDVSGTLFKRACFSCTNPRQQVGEGLEKDEWLPCANPRCPESGVRGPTLVYPLREKTTFVATYADLAKVSSTPKFKQVRFRRVFGTLVFRMTITDAEGLPVEEALETGPAWRWEKE